MRSNYPKAIKGRLAIASFLKRARRDEKGVTAVEFALIAMPFFAMLFGIIAVALFFFTTFTLENAIEQASRAIRTGQAQSQGMTTSEFKQSVCDNAPSYIDCGGKIRVNVQTFSAFGSVSNPSCTDSGGDLIPEPPPTPVPGAAGEIVLVTVCYQWDLAANLPFLKLGNMSNDSRMIRATTTFRTEPFGS
ncbi:MAG: TadE/TadG family type IV pilus assembly protein [Pseudomonadota bacterium]